jgi:ribonuclease E
MPNKMLIDATHPEETRVVVLRGQRVEEFDFESASRRQLRGNIYLAKVTRVEPSLQAAFVDYGGNRHGFLAFSEIHPDYYQIPVADRQALIAEEERAQRAAEAEAERRAAQRQRMSAQSHDEIRSAPVESDAEDENVFAMVACSDQVAPEADSAEDLAEDMPPHSASTEGIPLERAEAGTDGTQSARVNEIPIELAQLESSSAAESVPGDNHHPHADITDVKEATQLATAAQHHERESDESPSIGRAADITEVNGGEGEEEVVESVGGADAMEEVPERMPRLRRQYKIQEVIKRRQVMLVQVVKEERGTKGAALTTYLSLAGRYSVLMPNTARGGGISRKITSVDDRRRLKEIAQELDVPEGMGVILRTAGASRTKTEVKRDFEYLLRLWETVRDITLKSTAPKLVYEEGSLVKRSIRDLYTKEIDEIVVAGESAYREAKDFMRMLMPSHAKNVNLYGDPLPIFTRYGIESQLDAMFTPVMQLRSGGYIVLNQAEALVAIDVNSGRATREHHIEDTALKTNLEAAEEIARQLRLRDLAGLIVIDFIDMDEKRNNRAVERRLKECLRHDRARIQVGHISHFGLLEMSRQRIRSSVLESSTEKCPHCGGTGHVRSVASVALQLLRSLEETLLKGATHNLTVRTRVEVALYLLNQKRAHLRGLEERFRIAIVVNADPAMGGQVPFLIEKGEQVHSLEEAKTLPAQAAPVIPMAADEGPFEPKEGEPELELERAVSSNEEDIETEDEDQEEELLKAQVSEERPGRKRRRRRAGGRGGESHLETSSPREPIPISPEQSGDSAPEDELLEASAENDMTPATTETIGESNGERRRRRRGRRGGRRNRRERQEPAPAAELGVYEPELTRAVPDLDFAPQPSFEPPPDSEVQVRAREAQTPTQEQPTPTSAEPVIDTAEAEPLRRRSTVREPAPMRSSGEEHVHDAAPSPSAQPVVSLPAESATEDQPRRSGWWSRRVLGRH